MEVCVRTPLHFRPKLLSIVTMEALASQECVSFTEVKECVSFTEVIYTDFSFAAHHTDRHFTSTLHFSNSLTAFVRIKKKQHENIYDKWIC